MYTSEVDMFLRLKAGRFEVRRTLSRGQWGVTQDDVGRLFRNTNESALHVDLVPTHKLARNPGLRAQQLESLDGPGEAQHRVARRQGESRLQTGVRVTAGWRCSRQCRHGCLPWRPLAFDLCSNVFVAEPRPISSARCDGADL
jgi:hypothetical protein